MEQNNNKNLVIAGQKYPLLPVRDVVIFPAMVIPLAVGRAKSVRALEVAMATNRKIFLVTQKQPNVDDPQEKDIYPVGTLAEVLQLLKMADGTLKVLIEGLNRARWSQFTVIENHIEVTLEPMEETEESTPQLEAMMRRVVSLFEQYARLSQRNISLDIVTAISNITNPHRLVDTVASHIGIKITERQALLEIGPALARLEKMIQILNSEIEILNIERRIQNRVRNQIEKTQKEYYLTEQMKAIQKELRQKDDYAREIDELRAKIKAAKMSREAQDAALKELARLEKMTPFSPEATVSRTYLDWLINLPWAVSTEDNLDIKRAEKILNEDHYGLEKPKERVLEYLAVLKMVKKIKGPILCFVGPPGVGKTSLAKSIARALGRNFVRVSLGGVRDEAEIRGHRRTYIGSLPGRIIQSIRKAKSNNPVFILDEIDKMGTDWRGDPAAALLEVLDPEQNHAFSDHYLEVDFDLSRVMFITTANTLYSIPPSLVDRLEIISFAGYTIEEKLEIARRFLIPKQLKEHGLSDLKIEFSEEGLEKIIREYTQEAGVRNLEREIASICRKIAREYAAGKISKVLKIDAKTVEKFLRVAPYAREKISPNGVGVATGLAWTETGGEVLTVEAAMMPGKGALILTGKLGEVMKESAQAALSYVRGLFPKNGAAGKKFYRNDIHIHVPEGAIPKDGPSAGVTIATALASLLKNRPVKKDLAMTGEITLRGRILPIGGFKEKLIAAYREGIKTVLYPRGNEKDLEDIPDYIKKKVKLISVRTIEEVLKIALER